MLSVIKKFYRNYSTKGLTKYWLNPKKDERYWMEYLKTADHPRRHALAHVLKRISFISLFEVGCGSGPNLVNFIKTIGGKQFGGCDVNPTAIGVAQKTFQGAIFKRCPGDDLMMSDKSVDVLLSDMCLIYVGPGKIKDHLNEMKRVGRSWVVLSEYHSSSWWKRWKLRIGSGRHSYDYRKLLKKLGFHDTMVYKMPKFEEDADDEFRHIIISRIPKR